MPNVDRHAPGTFCWIELATSDQNAAHNFYKSVFGWEVNQFPMGPGDMYTIFRLQGRDVAAGYTLRPDQKGVPPHWMIYIAVESADKTAARIPQLGGKVFMPPFDVMDAGRMAVCSDPQGAMFCIWQANKNQGIGLTAVDGTLCWADLITTSQSAGAKFYSDLFGWKVEFGDEDPAHGYMHIKAGEEFIGGVPPEKFMPPGVPPHWMLYIYVADCDAYFKKATDAGGRSHMAPTTMEGVGRFAIVADPQGAAFAIFQPLPRK